jgi:hypothetical protein
MSTSMLSEVKDVEARVKQAMEDGPVTPYYTLPLDQVFKVLNGAVASEIICAPRYRGTTIWAPRSTRTHSKLFSRYNITRVLEVPEWTHAG